MEENISNERNDSNNVEKREEGAKMLHLDTLIKNTAQLWRQLKNECRIQEEVTQQQKIMMLQQVAKLQVVASELTDNCQTL